MRRILLTIAYDGTDFHGYAYQKNVRTVELEICSAIKAVTNEDVELISASRTDAGVHAYGNLAVFDTLSSVPAGKFSAALNTKLPSDVRIINSEEAAPDFHPRKTGWAKTYEYHILNSDIPNPIFRKYTYQFRYPLDIEAMNEAASYFVGTHDFTSFCSVHSQSSSRERTIYDCKVFLKNSEAVISVCGSGFLYNMVRIMAGTLLDVGRGRIKPDYIKTLLFAKDRQKSGKTLPPEGLFLIGYIRNAD